MPWTGGLIGRRKFDLTLATAIQAEEKDAGLQDDRVARKQRYVTALEKKLGGRFLEGLFKFKGSYSKFRCAPKAGDLKATDLDVGSVAARVSMFANINDHEAVDLFRALDGPPIFGEDGEELQFWQVKPVTPPKRYAVARGKGEKGAALASTVQEHLRPSNPYPNPYPNPSDSPNPSPSPNSNSNPNPNPSADAPAQWMQAPPPSRPCRVPPRTASVVSLA